MTENPYRRKGDRPKVLDLSEIQAALLGFTAQAIMMRDHGQALAEWGGVAGEEALMLLSGVDDQMAMQILGDLRRVPHYDLIGVLKGLHETMKSDA